MDINHKLNLLEELFDIEPNTLREENELRQLSQWDSMSAIALIAMFDDTFGKVLTPKEVKAFKTIKDITDKME